MKTAKRIKNKKTITKILEALEKKPKNHLLILFALNTGLRISDILSLQVKHVRDKNNLDLKEMKTGKERLVSLGNNLQQKIAEYTEIMEPDDYLFYAQGKTKNKPMSRFAVHKLLQRIAKKIGYNEPLSAHSLRKTYARMLYEATGDTVLLQELLNHTSQRDTLRYIGLRQEEILEITRYFEIY